MYVHCVYPHESIICLWCIVNRHFPMCSLSCRVPYTSKIFTIPSHFCLFMTPEVPGWSRGRSSTESLSLKPDVYSLIVSLCIMERQSRNSGIYQNQIFSSEMKLRSVWPCAFDSLHGRELCPSLGGEMIFLWCQASPPLSYRLRSRPRGLPCPPPRGRLGTWRSWHHSFPPSILLKALILSL